ncbi:hypothetical protein DM01DRAFT_1379138 [Hesseltinella vesiculosa]|uniref:PH domain-containing protein n=1 Tax=Hesseltinella vesiculosa TaxID=101127 RepID=A0A1X2G226_9FUNG|nr:hypothetical protein DM01DRAFT_1379138 [Hesseltinella vesiculosa]
MDITEVLEEEEEQEEKQLPALAESEEMNLPMPLPVTRREPSIYYNGMLDTLDQFPTQKLAWINDSSFAPELPSANLSKSDKPILLRKPHMKHQSSAANPRLLEKPKAMFYLRVLNITMPSHSKAQQYRCTVQIQDQLCTGSYVNRAKNGKLTSQVDLDHIFLLEMDQPNLVTLRIDVKAPKKLLGYNKKRKDITIGQQDFALSLKPFAKQKHTIKFQHDQGTFHVNVVYGSYMNEHAQLLIANQRLHADFLTIYIRGSVIPKWQRYWAVLHATKLDLYDFEYKESKPPQTSVPLHALKSVFHPALSLDDEETVDVGNLGLAMQFMPQVLVHQTKSSVLNYHRNRARMYVLPDHTTSAKTWEAQLTYSASLIDEFRPEGLFLKDTTPHDTQVPLKLLW